VTEELLLFRDMKAADDGLPEVGPFNFALGVRTDGPPLDIPVDRDGYVEPQAGRGKGMSVAPHDPRNLHPRHRPPALDGTGTYPIWRISRRDLGARLRYRTTSATHGVIEPVERMTLEEYEGALAATRTAWVLMVASD
jgi:hypothetical protein